MAGHIATSKSQDRCTPPWILDCVREAFGGVIELDPCSNGGSLVDADVAWGGPPDGTDGLTAAWPERGTVFVNPPFGTVHRHNGTGVAVSPSEWTHISEEERKSYSSTSLLDWTYKCVEEHEEALAEVILLTPANVDTKAWHKRIFPTAHAVCFLNGRVKFLASDGSKLSQVAPMPIALVYWGPHETQFENAMLSIGEVLFLGGSRRSMR